MTVDSARVSYIRKGTTYDKPYDTGDNGEVIRNPTEGKTDYLLVRDGPMFQRWAAHMTANSGRTGKRNWMRARSQADLDRFLESAARHFEQWLDGETDEDHAAAVFFNINGAEFVSRLLGLGGLPERG